MENRAEVYAAGVVFSPYRRYTIRRKDVTHMDFSENLRRLRLEKGMSQQALAELLHVSPKTVSKWETGENRPDIDTVILLARLCNVTTDSLLLGTEAEPPEGIPLPFAFLRRVLPAETIAAASGVSEETVIALLEAGELPNRTSGPKQKKLANILIKLTDTLPRFSRNETLLVHTLCTKLRENGVSESAIEHFALLDPGALRWYTDGGAPLDAEARVRLICALFLLDSILNREDSFPWD